MPTLKKWSDVRDEALRQRAEKGTIAGAIPLRLSAEMRKAVNKAAKKAGVAVAEWVRGAITERLGRS